METEVGLSSLALLFFGALQLAVENLFSQSQRAVQTLPYNLMDRPN